MGGSPGSVLVKLIFLSLLVGAFLAFLGLTPGAEAARELVSMAHSLRDDNEFDLTRLRGLLKVASS